MLATSQNLAGAHGIHLSRRADGHLQLLVVNHEGREAVEFLELVHSNNAWRALWRGCVENYLGSVLNDVVASPHGGFIATASVEFSALKADPELNKLLDGRNTGYLVRWQPKVTLEKIAGSESPSKWDSTKPGWAHSLVLPMDR